MPNRHSRLLAGGLLASGLSALLVAPPAARAEVLYTLDTTCTLRGGAAQPCQVQAQEDDEATLYRQTVGKEVITIRITDRPIRMSLQKKGSKEWSNLTNAGARFSTNTICFNNRDLCVVNPNYLNSVREENPGSLEGRDLVMVHFGPDGRVNISCYDEGCEAIEREAMKR
ncbi:MAG: hypothetical protein ACOVNL_08535 [Prochlorococcaceae cyanobacterium]|jgi:hypothetical protein